MIAKNPSLQKTQVGFLQSKKSLQKTHSNKVGFLQPKLTRWVFCNTFQEETKKQTKRRDQRREPRQEPEQNWYTGIQCDEGDQRPADSDTAVAQLK